jgi:hypothetical protein
VIFRNSEKDFGLVGEHLGHAQSTYQNAEKRLDQFTQKLVAADADPRQTLEARSDEGKRE